MARGLGRWIQYTALSLKSRADVRSDVALGTLLWEWEGLRESGREGWPWACSVQRASDLDVDGRRLWCCACRAGGAGSHQWPCARLPDDRQGQEQAVSMHLLPGHSMMCQIYNFASGGAGDSECMMWLPKWHAL